MTPDALFLGAYLLDSKSMGLLVADAGVSPKHLADGRMAQIYKTALDYAAEHGAVDRYAVFGKLQKHDILIAAMSEIPTDVPVATGRGAMQDIIRNHARKTIKHVGQAMIDDVAAEGLPVDEIIGKAQERIQELSTQGGAKIKTLATDREQKVETWKAARLGSGVVGIPLPWKLINTGLGGLRPRVMSVLGAYRATGKSSMTRQIAYETARAGTEVGLITLEDPSDIASSHIASLHGGFSTFHLDRGDSMVSVEQADKAWQEVERLPLHIYDRPSTIAQIENVCTAMSANYDTKLFIVDHIQHILPDRQYKSRNEEVAQYSMRLSALAKRLNCHVMVTSQLSRDSEKNDRAPRLSDLRDSGAIEQDARQVLMLYKDPERMAKTASGSMAPMFVLEVAKNNYGRQGDKVNMARRESPLRFDEAGYV